MHLEISTADWSEADARGLLALIEAHFPGITVDDQDDEPEYQLPTADEVFGAPATLDPAAAFAAPPLADAGHGAPAAPGGAPSPAIAGAPTPAPGAELDTKGLPWDERIHASTRRRNADGSWTRKKGLGNEHIDGVIAELRQRYPEPGARAAAPQPAAPPLAPPPEPAAAPPPPQPLDPAAVQAAQAAALADPTGFADGQSPAAAFGGAMKIVTAHQAAGKIDAKDIANIVADVGLQSMRELIQHPDKIPAFIDQVEAYAASAG